MKVTKKKMEVKITWWKSVNVLINKKKTILFKGDVDKRWSRENLGTTEWKNWKIFIGKENWKKMNKGDKIMKTKSVKFTWSCREITDIWTERKKCLNEKNTGINKSRKRKERKKWRKEKKNEK